LCCTNVEGIERNIEQLIEGLRQPSVFKNADRIVRSRG
jgi:hypothetical protein